MTLAGSRSTSTDCKQTIPCSTDQIYKRRKLYWTRQTARCCRAWGQPAIQYLHHCKVDSQGYLPCPCPKFRPIYLVLLCCREASKPSTVSNLFTIACAPERRRLLGRQLLAGNLHALCISEVEGSYILRPPFHNILTGNLPASSLVSATVWGPVRHVRLPELRCDANIACIFAGLSMSPLQNKISLGRYVAVAFFALVPFQRLAFLKGLYNTNCFALVSCRATPCRP